MMPNRNYTLKPTTTPLPGTTGGKDAGRSGGAPSEAGSAAQGDDSLRAENEDDDGYDPYSDRREERPLFERDPWE